MNPGSIVRCRNRNWVLLPGESPDVHLLRPLTGAKVQFARYPGPFTAAAISSSVVFAS
jgi:hypothetical protein